MKAFDLGWVVGIYEGEGSVSSRKNGKTDKHYPYLEVSMTDRDTIDRFAELLPGGYTNSYTRRKPHSKQFNQEIHRYRVTKRDLVAEYSKLLLPHLSERRQAQIEEVWSR